MIEAIRLRRTPISSTTKVVFQWEESKERKRKNLPITAAEAKQEHTGDA
jgi:hypothetical protein